MTLVTIFTDASCDSSRQIATYAAWARTGDGTRRWVGRLLHAYEGSNLAELAAIGRAVQHVASEIGAAPGDRWVVETDSEWAIRVLLSRVRRRFGLLVSPTALRMADRIVDVAAPALLDVRHVKGHVRRGEPRHAVNSWCDEAARAELRRWRSEDTCANR